jgi:biotin carboxyl carrier protein
MKKARIVRKVVLRTVAIGACGAAAWYGYWFIRNLPHGEEEIATTVVRRGDVVVRSYTRGELRAVRSATLTAPNLFGTVQVTRLAPSGAFAHTKDLIVEFDDSEVSSRVEERQLQLEQIDEQIKKAQADLAIRDNQDQVDLLGARADVQRAELEVKRNELLSAIDAKENVLALDEARRKVAQMQIDIKSRQRQALAQIAVLKENKATGLLELAQDKRRLNEVKLLAPITGLVAIRQNRTGFFFPGMEIPDIREGDQVQPGMPIADILDLSEMEMVAKVGEIDRANLKVGQQATIVLDALPNRKLHGLIKSLSATATASPFSFDPAKKFDVVFSLNMRELLAALGAKAAQIDKILATAAENSKREPTLPPAPFTAPGQPVASAPAPGKGGSNPRPPAHAVLALTPTGPGGPFAGIPVVGQAFSPADLQNATLPPPPEDENQFSVLLRPGLLADVEITIEKIPNAIHVPMQAVFEKEGKLVVYVKHGNQFEPRAIKPFRRSESTMVIASGLEPGEIVALADPTARKTGQKSQQKSGAMSALPGGGQ